MLGVAYDAFLSYRHGEPDQSMAQQLHRAIEAYRLPRHLARRLGRPANARAFLDDFELSGAANLNQELRVRLLAARSLFVLCTPRTPASQWVLSEIVAFREHAPSRIFAVLLAGDPAESIPPTLFDPHVADRQALYLDLRERGRRGRAEFLRLMACVHGCEFDELVARDRARRRRRFAITAAAMLGVAAMVVAYEQVVRDRVAASREKVVLAEDRAIRAERGTVESFAAERFAMDVGIGGLFRILQRQRFTTEGGLGFHRQRLEGDLANDLGDVQVALRRYEESLAGIETALSRADESTELRLELSIALERLGGAHLAAGDLVVARAQLERGLALARGLPLDHDKNRRALAFLLTGNGDVAMQQGRHRDALLAYQEAVDVRETLAHNGGDDVIDVSSARLKLADAMAALGRADDALQAHQDVIVRLGELLPPLQRDKRVVTFLAIARQRLGHALLDRGDGTAAERQFAAGAQLLVEASRLDPENGFLQLTAADSDRWLAEALLAQGRLDDAAEHGKKAADVTARVAAANPRNEAWRVAAARASLAVSVTERMQGDRLAAASTLRASLAALGDVATVDAAEQYADLVQALADVEEPAGGAVVARHREHLRLRQAILRRTEAADAMVRVAWAHYRLAGALRSSGDLGAALAEARQAVDLLDGPELVGDSSPTWWSRRRSYAYREYSTCLARSGDRRAASDWAAKAVAEAEALVARSPAFSPWRRALASALETQGYQANQAGDVRLATASLGRACDIFRDLSRLGPASREELASLAWLLMTRGDVDWDHGDPRDAIARYQESLELCRRLHAARPADVGFADMCARNLRWLGELHLEVGEVAVAVPLLRDSIAIHEELAASRPQVGKWALGASITRSYLGLALHADGRPEASFEQLLLVAKWLDGGVFAGDDVELNLLCVRALADISQRVPAATTAHDVAIGWLDGLTRWARRGLERRLPPNDESPERRSASIELRRMLVSLRDADPRLQSLRADPRFAPMFAFLDAK